MPTPASPIRRAGIELRKEAESLIDPERQPHLAFDETRSPPAARTSELRDSVRYPGQGKGVPVGAIREGRAPRRLFYFAVAAMLVVPILPAQAHAPRQRTFESDFVLHIRCDGFSLRDQVHVTGRTQRFFNQDGTRRRYTVHSLWEGTITNKTTGEVVGSDPGHWQDTFVGSVITTRGQLYSIRIASLGIFIQGIGRIVTDLNTGKVLFESSSDAHHQDYGDLCDALA
jgi:hypothetical protein